MSTNYKITSYLGAAFSWETYDSEEAAFAAANEAVKSGERATVEQSYIDDDGVECWEIVEESDWLETPPSFYVIEREYVGPNQDQHCDDHTVVIQNVPGRTNSSHEERTEGWLGTTNDWAVHAHGEYETIEAARAAIAEKFGKCRETPPVWEDDDTCIETYLVGEFAQMSREETGDWIYSGLKSEVTADTTNEQIDALIKEWEGECNSEGYTLDSRADDMARAYRDELIAERDEDDDND